MKDILKNLKRIYDDNNYNTLQSLQNQCWKLQTQSNNQKRFHYILWYNLLCCVKDDPSKWDRRHLIIYNNNIISQKQLNEIIVLDNRLTGQPHPLQNKMWSIIMNSQNTTCKECLNIIEQMEDTNEVLRFVKQYKSSIKMKFKMIRDTWLEFMSIIFQKLSQSPSNELLQSSFNLFQPQIKYMANQNDIPVVFKFYQKHFKFMSKLRVNEKLIQYARYVEHPDFIPLFIDILSPKAKRKKNYKHEIWWKNLKQCTEWWLDAFSLSGTIKILKDNNLEVGIITDIFEQSDKFSIDKYIPPELKSKLEMLLDSKTYDISIRNLVIHTIPQLFQDLRDDQAAYVINITQKLIQDKVNFEICESLLTKLIRTFNPFIKSATQNDDFMIKYVMSSKGKIFMDLLISLQKFPKFNQLSIKNRLTNFADWWISKVERTAQGIEDFSIVDQLSRNNCFDEINKLFDSADLKPIKAKFIRAAQDMLTKYRMFSERKTVINIFMSNFAPQKNFHGADIRKMDDLQTKLNNWDRNTLNELLTIDFQVYDENEKFLKLLANAAKSKIKVSVFKSIIEEQEAKWTLKPLKQFTTRDSVQWLRRMIDEFDENEVKIKLEYLVECFYKHEIKGKTLIANDLEENKIAGWFKSDSNNKVTNEDCDNVAAIIMENIKKRKHQDEDLVNIQDKDKKIDFYKLQHDVYQNVDKIINQIATELSLDRITVGTTQKYLNSLAQEEEKQIENELRSILQNVDDDIDFVETAQAMKSLFANIKKIENYQLLYDASQIFKKIIINYDEEKDID
eukprot:303079_1